MDGVGLVVWAGQAGPTAFSTTTLGVRPVANDWSRLPNDGRNPSPAMARARPSAPTGGCGSATASPRTASVLRHARVRLRCRPVDRRNPDGKQPVVRCLHACWLTADGRFALYAGQTTGVRALGDLWALNAGEWAMVDGQLPPAGRRPPWRRRGRVRRARARRRLSPRRLSASTERRSRSRSFAQTEPGRPHVPAQHSSTTRNGRVLLFGGTAAGDAFADTWQLTLP